MVCGTFVMLVVFTMCLTMVETYVIQQDANTAQLAADTVADATAVYVAGETEKDYEDALEYAEGVQELIEEQTGVITGDLHLDQDAFSEEETAKVSLGVYGRYTTIGLDKSRTRLYEVVGHAATKYTVYEDYVQWMVDVAADDSHGYSMANRTFSPDVDCSSFVYYALLYSGYPIQQYCPYPFATGSMGTILIALGFHQLAYDADALQEGDIFVNTDPGALGHTGVYLGDGQSVEARGASYGSSLPGDQGTEVSVGPMSTGKPYQYIYRR